MPDFLKFLSSYKTVPRFLKCCGPIPLGLKRMPSDLSNNLFSLGIRKNGESGCMRSFPNLSLQKKDSFEETNCIWPKTNM